jgi:ribose/xylose/arabinose/galactoside ABC-type transport system permease subunit
MSTQDIEQKKPGGNFRWEFVPGNLSVSTIVRAVIVVALVMFAVTTPGFLTMPSIRSLLSTMSFMGCVAVGMTFITLSGNIMSFSLGASLSATSIVFVVLLPQGVVVALAAAVVFNAVLNGAQGLLIGYFRANPIIVTMAAFALITGTFTYLTGGRGFYVLTNDADFLKANLGPVPGPFAALLVCVIVGQAILWFTRTGRNVYLVGSNPRAALAAGIEPWPTVVWSFALAGVFTSVSAIMMAARYGSGDLQHGIGMEYQAISAVLIGGNFIGGGQGSVLRTLSGIVLISVFQGVLVLRGFSTEMQQLLIGVVVFLVIALQWRKES